MEEKIILITAGQGPLECCRAVRIKHHLTGIQIQVMDTRSQLENKKLAAKRLAEKLEALKNEEASKLKQEARSGHLSLQRGNPVKEIRKPL